MGRFTYQGTKVPKLVPVALFEGWEDAATFPAFDQLYRKPTWKKTLYVVGFYARLVLGLGR